MRNRILLAICIVAIALTAWLLWVKWGSGSSVGFEGDAVASDEKLRAYALTMNGSPLTPSRYLSVADSQVVQAGQQLVFEGWFDLSDEYQRSLPRFHESEQLSGMLILAIYPYGQGDDTTILSIRMTQILDEQTARMSVQGTGTAPSAPGIYHVSAILFDDMIGPGISLVRSLELLRLKGPSDLRTKSLRSPSCIRSAGWLWSICHQWVRRGGMFADVVARLISQWVP